MSVVTLHRPSLRDALVQFDAATERGDLITLFGRCTVEYDGRAASSLGPGDRLVVLKPDGSALVHTDEKRTPVNWQPPGCDHAASVRDGRLCVRSTRTSPAETLDVRFERVEQFTAYDVTDPEDLDLRGSEEDLRQYVLEHPERIEAGFDPRETERESDAGPMDIYGEDDAGRPVVVELKRRRVGPSAASQLARYVDALRREFGDGVDVRGVLVAPSVTDRAAELLDEEGLEFVALDPKTGRPPADGDGDGDEAGSDDETERVADGDEGRNGDGGDDGGDDRDGGDDGGDDRDGGDDGDDGA